MSRWRWLHRSPIPVSMRTRRSPRITRRQRKASSIRLRSSGGLTFAHSGRGTTPNIVPPSRAKLPSRTSCTSNVPIRRDMARSDYTFRPVRYELLIQASEAGQQFDAERADAAFAKRPFRERPDGTRLWCLKHGEVEVRPLVEGGRRLGTELRAPLQNGLDLIRELVVEGAAVAQEAGARLVDPQLGRGISAVDEGAVADQYFQTARYAGEMAGVSEAVGVGMVGVEPGFKPGTKVLLGLAALVALVAWLFDRLLG